MPGFSPENQQNQTMDRLRMGSVNSAGGAGEFYQENTRDYAKVSGFDEIDEHDEIDLRQEDIKPKVFDYKEEFADEMDHKGN